MQNHFGLLVSNVMPIYDHCLGYRHNYLLFYQFPNSNLFTHHMLFSREKPLVKIVPPGSIFYHILKLKIPCCNFTSFILFCTRKYARALQRGRNCSVYWPPRSQTTFERCHLNMSINYNGRKKYHFTHLS